jgi:hypothetical protein
VKVGRRSPGGVGGVVGQEFDDQAQVVPGWRPAFEDADQIGESGMDWRNGYKLMPGRGALDDMSGAFKVEILHD